MISGEGLLPTTKSIAFASWQFERGLLQYVSPDDPEQQEFFVSSNCHGQANLALRPRERAARDLPRNGAAPARALKSVCISDSTWLSAAASRYFAEPRKVSFRYVDGQLKSSIERSHYRDPLTFPTYPKSGALRTWRN